MPARNTPPGPAVDAFGQAVIDPTKNVIDRVELEARRQDDLREKESSHIRELASLRAEYDEKLRVSESARIDAIRAVDQGNVQRAAEVQAAAALTLATQVSTSAEALRAAQAQATGLADTKLVTALEPIQADIRDLRDKQSQAMGQKTQVVESRTNTTNIGWWIFGGIAAVGVLGGMFLTFISIVLGGIYFLVSR